MCFQDNKADVILKYNAEEARSLKAYGELPEHGKESETRYLSPILFLYYWHAVVLLTAKIDEWHAGEEDEIQFDDNGVDGEDADDVSSFVLCCCLIQDWNNQLDVSDYRFSKMKNLHC